MALAMVAGCKGGGSTATDASTPGTKAPAVSADMKTATLKDGSATITVPKDYTDLISQNPAARSSLDEAAKKQPWMATAVEMSKNEMFQYMGMDVRPESHIRGFSENINVVVTAGVAGEPKKEDLEAGAKDIATQFKTSANVKSEVVTLSTGPAIHYSCTMDVPNPSTPTKCDLIGYALPRKGKIYTITYSMPSGNGATTEARAKEIAESLTIK